MTIKAVLYLFSIPLVLYSMDGININFIFKKNRIWQARIFYLIICLVLSYLLVNFIYDFGLNNQIVG